jgi:hypothetical protein
VGKFLGKLSLGKTEMIERIKVAVKKTAYAVGEDDGNALMIRVPSVLGNIHI